MNLIFLISIEVLEKDFIFLYNNNGDNMDNKKEYKMSIRNFFGHLNTVNKHRFKVFCLCCRVGIPVQGLLHDLSKYMPVEFLEGVKYYQGTYSPIMNCKRKVGYSLAWIHHINCNKHHYEYWYDYGAPNPTPLIPFKYFLEMVCDSLSAGITYEGKNWTKEYQLSYWNRTKDRAKMDERMKKLLERVYTEISIDGINKVLKRKHLKELYIEYTKE